MFRDNLSFPSSRATKFNKCFLFNLTFICPCIANIFAQYNQQDATFLNLFISVRCSTCFRRVFCPSSGAQNCTWRNHNTTSSFTQHLTEEAHSFGPMNKIMKIVHCHKKGANLNTIEKFLIHTESAKNNHLNDPQTILPSAIFDTLIKTDRPTIKF